MERILTWAELERERLLCTMAECHLQTWREGSSWNTYVTNPRPSNGLLFVLSPIRASFYPQNAAEITVSAGTMLYIPQGERYRVNFTGGGASPDLITVNFALQDMAGNAVRPAGKGFTATPITPECRLLAGEFAKTYADPRQSKLRGTARLFDLLAAVAEATLRHSADYEKIRRGVELLESEWSENAPIGRYAAAAGMSESGFYHHFKQHFALSPNEYRIQLRVRAARSMLRNDTLSIKEIAYLTGFADPYYFSRCFARAVGLSPRAYRQGR